MPEDDALPTPFDEILDRVVRGEDVDADAVIREHPELSEEERSLLHRLCGGSVGTDGAPAAPDAPPRATPSDAPPVSRIGTFRLEKRIGAGGMGAVFLAHDEALGREIAVKIIGPDLVGTGERAERFLREVRAVARLRHPNIVDVYAAGEQDGLRYMAMEFVPGTSLHDLIGETATRGTRLRVPEALRIGVEIARALHSAHEAGIVHRDVKPSNIRIATDGRAVLLDFGLAREVGSATLTESGAFRGSPQYASPEQVGLAGAPIGRETDVFSLGATLYEALTGVAPFRGETREQLFHAILTRDPVPPRRLDPSLPRDLETVILAALEKDPARRPPTAAALADDLERVREGRPVSVRPPSLPGRMWRWARRQPAKAALLLALIVGIPLIAALGGFILANLSKIEEATQAAHARDLSKVLENAFFEWCEGAHSQAPPLFEEALRMDPASPLAQAGYAMSLIYLDQAPAALAFLDGAKVANRDAAWPARVRDLARIFEADGDEVASRPVDPSKPLDSVDHFILGMIEIKRVHHGVAAAAQAAFEHLEKAVLAAPSATSLYHYELGHAAYHANRAKEATEVANAIESLFPESPERLFAVGRMLLIADQRRAKDRFEKASRSLRGLAQRNFVLLWLCQFGFTDEELPGLIEMGRKTAEMHTSAPEAREILGMVHYSARDFEAAAREAKETIRVDPKYAGGHFLLSQSLSMTNDREGALAAAREGAALAPKDMRGQTMLGVALAHLGRDEESIGPFEQALKLGPDSAANLCNLGNALVLQGEFKKGLALLEKGHAKGKKTLGWNVESERWVAEAQRMAGLEKRLEEVRAGGGEPPSPEERLMLAHGVCRRQKRFAEAASLSSAAFEADPTLSSQRGPDYLMEAAGAALAAGRGSVRGRAGGSSRAPEAPRPRALLARGRARGKRRDDPRATRARLGDPGAPEALDPGRVASDLPDGGGDEGPRAGRDRGVAHALGAVRRHPRREVAAQPIRSDQSASRVASTLRARTSREFAAPRLSPTARPAVAMSWFSK